MRAKLPPPARPSRWPAVACSLVLHGAILAGAAALPAGVLAAGQPVSGPDRPTLLTWSAPSNIAEPVVATAPVSETTRVPAPAPERIVEIDVAVEELPPLADRSVEESASPDPFVVPRIPSASRMRIHDAVALRPASDGGEGPAAAAGGGGTMGVGGPGSPGGGVGAPGGAGIVGGRDGGSGRGDGSAGSDGGSPGGGGATRGPSALGALPAPPYPPKARSHGWEGRVVLLLTIDPRGRVLCAEIAESSGRTALDEAAREAAPDWTFSPALRDGAPVAGTLRVPVRFELTD